MKNSLNAFLILVLSTGSSYSQTGQAVLQFKVRYNTLEARQGVAVDNKYFYTINSDGIGKYEKVSGNFVTDWKDSTGRIRHLNSGIVVNNLIYCANSNYPQIPMQSSIEIFFCNDLSHKETRNISSNHGSVVWIDRYDNSWWVCFANYDQFRTILNKGTESTLLVRYDLDWNELGYWSFPADIISELKPMSASGGSWGPDGNLYITGHDSSEVYILNLPEKGQVLKYLQTMKTISRGQGIAWDRTERNIFYGIIRKDNSVIISELMQK